MICKWLKGNGGSEIDIEASGNRTSVLKAFENHYSSKIMIVAQLGRPNLICSSSLDLGKALGEAKRLSDCLQEFECTEFEIQSSENSHDETAHVVQETPAESFHVAKAIGKQIQNLKDGCQPDSLSSEEPEVEVNFECAPKCVPVDLYNLLAWMVFE